MGVCSGESAVDPDDEGDDSEECHEPDEDEGEAGGLNVVGVWRK